MNELADTIEWFLLSWFYRLYNAIVPSECTLHFLIRLRISLMYSHQNPFLNKLNYIIESILRILHHWLHYAFASIHHLSYFWFWKWHKTLTYKKWVVNNSWQFRNGEKSNVNRILIDKNWICKLIEINGTREV